MDWGTECKRGMAANMTTGIGWHYLFALLYIITSVSYMFLGAYTLVADIKSKARRLYMIAIVWLMVWSLMYGLMLISGNETTALFFWRIGFIANSLFFPGWIHFLIYVTGYKLKNKLWLLFLYAGSIILSFLGVALGDVIFEQTRFGFLFSYGVYPIFKVSVVYFFALFLIMGLLHFYWWRTVRTQHQKNQLRWFIVITFVIAAPGFLADYILPAFLGAFFVPIAAILVLTVSLQLASIMNTFSSMSISVKNVSEDIFKSIPMPILLLDHENRIIHVNDAAAAIWGRNCIDRNVTGLFLVNKQPPGPELFNRDLMDVVVSVKTPQGEKHYDLLLKILTNRHGDVHSKIVALNDISEMLSALERANESSRAKSAFLSRMSHEMRTPMNAIIGMTNIGRDAQDAARVKYCLGKIDEASKHLLSLINDVLDMSTIEANKMEIRAADFVLSHMIEKIKSIMAVKAEEKKQNFSVNVGVDIPDRLVGDDLRLTQVIMNLLSNAMKFTPEGGHIVLNVSLVSPTEEGGLTIKVEVVDSGIGLKSEHYNKIFSSFEQADGDINRTYGGTGLGLAISKNIIELMGGRIEVTSEEGKGSCFCFLVNLRLGSEPPNSAGQRVRAVSAQLPDGVLRGKSILLVEDVEINREIVTALFEDTGIVFDYAENGQIAVGKFKEGQDKYSLIFMDVQMPIMDGLEATRQIRAFGTTQAKDIPIIAMTANAFSKDIESCIEAGMNGHISKPIDFDEVVEKLLDYLA